ncbi:hypothetical protein CAEBREN_06211 [Caenorhabditis brenneri]|uniref:Uncharacterized protein n=1 Tax=Caenorhabditis brenneri TaxID=135651 RepID=G0MHP9_CAEBE|nr:hypothetical protein CAEBREN_06211 [Caenorhabditis brenneri]
MAHSISLLSLLTCVDPQKEKAMGDSMDMSTLMDEVNSIISSLPESDLRRQAADLIAEGEQIMRAIGEVDASANGELMKLKEEVQQNDAKLMVFAYCEKVLKILSEHGKILSRRFDEISRSTYYGPSSTVNPPK